MGRPELAAAIAAAALGLAATILLATGLSASHNGSVLLEVDRRTRQGWQMLRPWLEPPENLEDLGVSWGRFDCFRYGPLWESRALGCDRPGGCDAPIEPPVFESNLEECGDTSEPCVQLFKSCLLHNHAETAAPTPSDCYCYFDVVELGCTPECVNAIFKNYGELSQRCYGFSVYTGCRYIDAHREPEDQTFGMLKAHTPLLLLDADADADVDAGPVDADAAFVDADPEPLMDPDSEPVQVDAGPEPLVEAVDADPPDMDQPVPVEEDAVPEGWIDPYLQFRQPAGTYVQQDMSGTLIEPWQYNSNAFDPRVDPPFDDDDPRE